MADPTDASVARKLLRAVAVLHGQGYEQLRACPSISPTGIHWRCTLAPARNVLASHGARICSDELVARYTTGDGPNYFALGDFSARTAEDLALAIRERFSELLAASLGPDEAYVTWYAEMLEATEPDHVPYAGADWDVPEDYLPAAAGWTNKPMIQLPLPPPGGCGPSST